MRPNQQNNKQRSRGRNNNNQRRGGGGGNPLSRNYESNGPDVKIRGNAAHIAEKYVQLARDASSVGDNVMAENYLQHAEHYFRIILAAQAQYQPRQDQTVDTSAEDDDEYDTAAPNGNGEAAEKQSEAQPETQEAGEEQREPRQRRQRRPRRERVEGEAATEAAGGDEQPAEAAPAAEKAGEEEAPKRARRTRRKKTESEDEGPAPELPAFLTAGREAAAE